MSALSRRELFYGLLVLGLAGWPARGDAVTLRALNGVNSAFPQATAALRGIADGFTQLLSGAARLSPAAARDTRERLTRFSHQLVEIGGTQRPMLSKLEEFYDTWRPPDLDGARRYPSLSRAVRLRLRSTKWQEVVNRMATIMRVVEGALDVLNAERSDFVRSGPYERLKQAFEGRRSVLQRLLRSPAPASAPAFAALAISIRHYRELHGELRRTIALVDRYVLSLPA